MRSEKPLEQAIWDLFLRSWRKARTFRRKCWNGCYRRSVNSQITTYGPTKESVLFSRDIFRKSPASSHSYRTKNRPTR